MQTAPELLTPLRAHEAIGRRVSPSTLKRWVREGKIDGQKISGIQFIDMPSLKKYLQSYKGGQA